MNGLPTSGAAGSCDEKEGLDILEWIIGIAAVLQAASALVIVFLTKSLVEATRRYTTATNQMATATETMAKATSEGLSLDGPIVAGPNASGGGSYGDHQDIRGVWTNIGRGIAVNARLRYRIVRNDGSEIETEWSAYRNLAPEESNNVRFNIDFETWQNTLGDNPTWTWIAEAEYQDLLGNLYYSRRSGGEQVRVELRGRDPIIEVP